MEITTNLKKSKKKGFTLIELIIVIAIIGIIALIAIPKFGNAQKEAKINADLASAKTIANATSMLITKGEISKEATEAGKKYEVNKAIELGADGVGKTISNQLQNIPVPKAVSGKFFIIIDESDNVKIGSGADAAKAATHIVYPE